MKKYIVTCLVGLCTGLTTARSPFKCTLYDRENKIYVTILFSATTILSAVFQPIK